jgi:putative hydrolase of the HAD superfamily
VKFVLFDLDDTLTDRQASLERYVATLIADFAEELGPAEAALVLAAIIDVDERGYAPRERVFNRLLSALTWRSVPTLGRLADHWREQFPRSTLLRPGALETLKALRKRGFTLGLVTNGPVSLQQMKIDQVGIAPLFEVIVISEQVGVHKPDPRVFQRALDQLACAGGDAWYVGDHPRNDVLGAAGVGITPIWLAGVHPWPEGVERPGRRIDRLEDVMLAVTGDFEEAGTQDA